MLTKEQNLRITTFITDYAKAKFEFHCMYLMNSVLNKWTKEVLLKDKYPLVVNNPNKPLIIFIDDRPTEILRFTIINSLIMCRLKMKGVLYTLQSKVSALKDFLYDLKDWVDVVPINDNDIKTFAGKNYSHLLKRKSFWEQIPSNKVLIVQTDALLIEPIDFSIFNYDYVGAPFTPGKFSSIPIYTYSSDLMRECGVTWITLKFQMHDILLSGKVLFGNGGLSVRNTSQMINMCNIEPKINNEPEPEDIYFGRLLSSNKGKLPSLRDARRFACESEYFDSIGSHASHLYLKDEEQAKIYARHISHLNGIITASYEQ
tara:strand:+ start:932 stop:1879 length:948 start_codon:yes stop_codon:yes gene_type:complete